MKKIKKAEKTSDGRIIVKSTAYGKHSRAKRGTHKEAKLNDSFKASSERLAKANLDAQVLKKALEPFLWSIKPRLFWQRLLSVIRSGYKANSMLAPEKFAGFEVYDQYYMSRLCSPTAQVEADQQLIRLELSWHQAPHFKRKYADGFLFGALCIFVNQESSYSESLMKFSNSFPLKCKAGNCTFEFENKPSFQYALLFLTLNPTEKGLPNKGAAVSGFSCIWGKRLKELDHAMQASNMFL